eukprot:12994132-Alexandrium_andersonii.AAC.1
MLRQVPALTVSSRWWHTESSPFAEMNASTACSRVSPAACQGRRPAWGAACGGEPGGGAT